MTVYILSLDPATGSGESKPAFALWELQADMRCKLVDCGAIHTNGATHWARMQSLCDQLPVKLAETFGSIKDLAKVKQVVIEGLAPVMGGSFGGMQGGTNRAFVHLHHAVAVMCCAYPWPNIEECCVQTWKSFLVGMGYNNTYRKSDTNDAITIGMAWLCEHGSQVPVIPPAVLNNMGMPVLDPVLWETWGRRMATMHAAPVPRKRSTKKRRAGRDPVMASKPAPKPARPNPKKK